jgi:nicotinate phosphoribosyltransferase
MEWGKTMLDHYKKLGVLTQNKRFVFSDNLNVEKYVALDKYFRNWAQPVGGIGTFFTNDVGVKPLNMVIKMVSADFGFGPVDVVKLSDDPSKHVGKPEAIAAVKRELSLPL